RNMFSERCLPTGERSPRRACRNIGTHSQEVQLQGPWVLTMWIGRWCGARPRKLEPQIDAAFRIWRDNGSFEGARRCIATELPRTHRAAVARNFYRESRT